MHKKNLMALPLALLLGACGGSGSGTADSPARTTYALQLVTLQEDSLANTQAEQCQVYYQTGNDTYYYASRVNDPSVALYNADGTQAKTLSVSDTGLVVVYADEMPEGGYLAITSTAQSQAFTEYNVLALDASLLGTLTLSVASSQKDGACLTGSYQQEGISSGYATLTLDDSFTSAPAIYRFDNGHDSFTSAKSVDVPLTTYGDQPVLVTAYGQYDADSGQASNMVGYAFVAADALCERTGCAASQVLAPLSQRPAIAFYNQGATDSAELRLNDTQGDYHWQTLTPADSDFSYTDALAEANWYAKAQGQSQGWALSRQQHLSNPEAGVDVDLLGSLNLADADPSLSGDCGQNQYGCVLLEGTDASAFGYQRTLVSAYSSSGKSYLSLQLLGQAKDSTPLPQVQSAAGSVLLSRDDLLAGSVTVSLVAADSALAKSAFLQHQLGSNLASQPFYYGTVLSPLASQEAQASVLASGSSLVVSRQ